MPYELNTPQAEVRGRVVISFTNALPMYSDTMTAILKKHELVDIRADGWYNMQNWLNALKEVGDTYGASVIMSIGQALPETLPEETDNDFRSVFAHMNTNYQESHRKGDIGFIEVAKYNDLERQAKIRVVNPYPPEFAEGIIKGLIRKYKPQEKGVVPRVNTELNPDNEDDRIYHTSW